MIDILKYTDVPQKIREKLDRANVFFQKEYADYINSTGWEVLYAYNDSMIIPIQYKKNHHFFNEAIFLSEPYCFDKCSDEKNFLDDVVGGLKKEYSLDFLLMTPTHCLFHAYPTDSLRIKFGNYILSLENDDLLQAYTSKHRNMVRRGEKGGVEVKIGGIELLNDYVLLDKETWERSDKIVDNTERYKAIIDNLPNNSLISVAYKDGVPQCGILGLFNPVMFYYMFGATANRSEPGATHYMHWITMKHLQELGVKSYNFVGCRINEDPNSKYHSIQHFKKGFGGELNEVYMFKSTVNVGKYKLFRQLAKVKEGNVPNDIIDQEIHKWQDIND